MRLIDADELKKSLWRVNINGGSIHKVVTELMIDNCPTIEANIKRNVTDSLTHLLNRESFINQLQEELEICAEDEKCLSALMFIDIDDFKMFNDNFSHACGDEVLKFVADTLSNMFILLPTTRGVRGEFSGRFGSDEFVVCMTDMDSYGTIGKIAQEILDTLQEGFLSNYANTQLGVSCSIGIAFLRENGKTCEDVIAAADEAMYNIKKHGKSAFAFAKKKDQY